MRRVAPAILAFAALAGAAAPAAAAGARGVLDEGFVLYGARRYAEAAAKFEEASARAGAEGLDAAVAGYDRGIALLRAGRGAESAAAFAEAMRSTDPRLREASLYHRGLALTAAAEVAEGAGERQRAIALLEEALGAYEGAMRVDPADEDPKVNHELVARRLARLAETMKGQERSAGGGPPEEKPRGGSSEEGGPRREDPSARETPPARPGNSQEMRPDEARTLLDAMRQQEQSQRARTRPPRGEVLRVEKDW